MKKIQLIATLLIVTAFLGGCKTPNFHEKSGNPDQQSSHNDQWTEIAPGLTYGNFHVALAGAQEKKDFQITVIDPKIYNLSIIQNNDKDTAKNMKEIQDANSSLIAFNGGFFTEEFKPTGLLISKNRELHAISKADLLNGIFLIDKTGKPDIIEPEKFSPKNTVFAIQNGPLLMLNNQIKVKSDTGKTASRTAIGVDTAGNIVLILVKQSLLNSDNTITLYELANLLKDAPELRSLKLKSALNLDGGPSTGMIIRDQYYPEMEKVQNVVIVTGK